MKLAPLILATLALAACQGEKPVVAKGTAGGEILEASVSDEMLPLDRVRSQPPLAPKSAGSEPASAAAGDKPVRKAAAAPPKAAASVAPVAPAAADAPPEAE
jgi:hypothetical protein